MLSFQRHWSSPLNLACPCARSCRAASLPSRRSARNSIQRIDRRTGLARTPQQIAVVHQPPRPPRSRHSLLNVSSRRRQDAIPSRLSAISGLSRQCFKMALARRGPRVTAMLTRTLSRNTEQARRHGRPPIASHSIDGASRSIRVGPVRPQRDENALFIHENEAAGRGFIKVCGVGRFRPGGGVRLTQRDDTARRSIRSLPTRRANARRSFLASRAARVRLSWCLRSRPSM